MGLFGSKISKSVEEIQKEKRAALQEKLNQLNTKYADIIDHLCKLNDMIFVFLGFGIVDGKIIIKFQTKDTLPGYYTYKNLEDWNYLYGETSLKTARMNFVQLKEDFKKLGIKLEKIEKV